MFAWCFLLLVLFLPQCPCDFFRGYNPTNYISSSEDTDEENDLIHALDNILNFFYIDMENVNMDGLVGIIVAEAQLNVILRNLGKQHILYDKIFSLQMKCHNLNKMLKKSVRIKNYTYQKIHSNLLRTKIWELQRLYLNRSLNHFPPYNWTNIPYSKIIRLFYKGPPSGDQSDFCLGEILDSLYPNSIEHECIPSLGCHKIMSELHTSHGYPLTHKLLYIQISRGLKCKLDENVVADSVNYLCSRILREFRAIENYPYKKTTSFQDMYLEQMVLCGMEGFAEFLTQTSRKNLLKWQSTYGCYGKDHRYDDRGRAKRDTRNMRYGCESHISGLAAAALAINLNYLISDAMSESPEEYSNILMLL